jgi:hypothetical protein
MALPFCNARANVLNAKITSEFRISSRRCSQLGPLELKIQFFTVHSVTLAQLLVTFVARPASPNSYESAATIASRYST